MSVRRSTAVLSLLVVACTQPGPSEEDLAEIARLDSVISTVTADIAAAREAETEWAEGLLGVLASARREILETTDAMLQQRVEALRSGARFDYSVAAHTPDSERVHALELEIARTEEQLRIAQQETDRYSGGLLRVMALAEVATARFTLTSLRHQRVAAMFGLPVPQVELNNVEDLADNSAQAPQPSSSRVRPRTAAPTPPKASFDILEISTRVTERNAVWWRYAWRLSIKNTGPTTLVLNATIEFQDEDGFVVDTDDEYNLVLAAGEEKTFTGSALIDVESAASVGRVNAEVRQSRF